MAASLIIVVPGRTSSRHRSRDRTAELGEESGERDVPAPGGDRDVSTFEPSSESCAEVPRPFVFLLSRRARENELLQAEVRREEDVLA
jgi:hypothetical protein